MSVATLLAGVLILAMQAGAADPADFEKGRMFYRWSDFRAQVNYGDRPPPDAQNLIRIDLRQIGEQTQSLLPYQVRRAASNFPVMLFTAKNCPPCNSARAYLTKRGIPFAERTIETSDDAMELKRLTNIEGVPVATLGTQVLVAFDAEDWDNGLDATGYPKTSQLPPSFKQEPARPLTQKEKPPTVAAK
jgi:glutaredoxin